MARPLRIEYAGAVYHVICRGNNRQAVFRDDQDRRRYLEKLSLYLEEKNVDLLAYCLLSNHVHLLLETPEGNLSKMMQPFQTSYTVYFNKRHRRSGHVFEQRYKALLVDKDKYLLEVSRYIHLNPAAARIVERPQDYRWSSYGSYLKGKGILGLKSAAVLGYFSGGKSNQLDRYREYVEGGGGEKERQAEPPVVRQAFVGDEEFVERVTRKAKTGTNMPGHYSLKRIVAAVSKVSGVKEDDLRRPGRNEEIMRSRELISYVSRRYSDVSLRELARFLQVKELSTPSHGVRRAEERLKNDAGFGRQAERVLSLLRHTFMQA